MFATITVAAMRSKMVHMARCISFLKIIFSVEFLFSFVCFIFYFRVFEIARFPYFKEPGMWKLKLFFEFLDSIFWRVVYKTKFLETGAKYDFTSTLTFFLERKTKIRI